VTRFLHANRSHLYLAGAFVLAGAVFSAASFSTALAQGYGGGDYQGGGYQRPPVARPPVKGPSAGGAGKNIAPLATNSRYITREVVIEVEGNPTEAEADALARRFRLTRVQSQSFPLIGSTVFRWTIPDNRSPEAVARQLSASPGIRSAQPNYRYALQQSTSAAAGDPAQYALLKLRLGEAHNIAVGRSVVIAMIDSGVDTTHPEFAGAIASTFDALGSTEGPHVHGTGIAGAMIAHGRIIGSAPSAKLLAIRAFGAAGNSAESTSFIVLKSLDHAVASGARIINMSFAGPKDPILTLALASAASRGIVLIAAAGNAGPKSPPLYPAADPNVIAVSATDSSDRLFAASNRGAQIALSAPGVELFLPSVGGKYQVTSGTSFAAAYVSGIAALLLERNATLTRDALRVALVSSAHDLGAKGRDDSFGAGLADAMGALAAVAPPQTASTASTPAR
jgi:subtilisin family serine protease